ncbi:DegT/DnrJ/EryC1/StrS family aminotransferase [Calditerrivibrio nitroreducens]|uniref:DegT/DnrJ/EryC1/StrS aminotransferase n=1 Tax=Calditerrivibrio nitroreducens (strain DSM 19672 / NBRC 101217 / Yu37-1) TaxID=768670 RepID=E4TGB6_CALNY|nr:DegT/DnrJ/EryC1/StrS family aminotransferase [Calditerrivibrio nitroreducens]ADR19703.1 DegT/DnrJ/EryC1/StrS aminotransferase [Calditerrivibrio nitroreducens DSM 19672]
MSTIYTFFKGRVALYAILKGMGIKEGDEVILPGFTCVVVPNAICYTGGRPVYVDIDPSDYNIDVNKIEEKITDKTKAIIAQHTFGIPARMDEIRTVCKKYNLFLIEDACHCLGSTYKGVEMGNFGDAAFFSSQWSKPVTTGLGGWAQINNPDLIASIERVYADFNIPSKKEELLLDAQYNLYEKFLTPKLFWIAQSSYRKLSSLGITVGSSSNDELEYEKPQNFEKRMGLTQERLLFKKLLNKKEIISHRKKITSIYREYFLNEYDKLKNDNTEIIFLRFPLLVRDKKGILAKAKRFKIELGDWFLSPLHPNLTGWEKVFYQKGECPIAEDISERIINLPTHDKIDEKEAKRIAEFVIKYR